MHEDINHQMVLKENTQTLCQSDGFINCDPEQITSSLSLFNYKIRKTIPQAGLIISFSFLFFTQKAALLKINICIHNVNFRIYKYFSNSCLL